MYFLLQAGLAYWNEVSPYDPIGSTLALAFVLAVGAVKAAVEDGRRWAEDRRQNRQAARVLRADGAEEARLWRDVHVGDVLLARPRRSLSFSQSTFSSFEGDLACSWRCLTVSAAALMQVRDGEEFPADMVCLSVALSEGICYVQTANLGAAPCVLSAPLFSACNDRRSVLEGMTPHPFVTSPTTRWRDQPQAAQPSLAPHQQHCPLFRRRRRLGCPSGAAPAERRSEAPRADRLRASERLPALLPRAARPLRARRRRGRDSGKGGVHFFLR